MIAKIFLTALAASGLCFSLSFFVDAYLDWDDFFSDDAIMIGKFAIGFGLLAAVVVVLGYAWEWF